MTAVERNVRNLEVSLSFYGPVSERSGVLLITAPVAYSVFNIAMLSAPAPEIDGELERRIHVARSHYESLAYPWSFWVCEDYLGRSARRRLHDCFHDIGLGCIADPPGMEAAEFPPPRRPLPDLQFRPVTDSVTRAAFARMASACFQIPADIARAVYENERAWRAPLRMWIGYHEGQPVTSAATVEAGAALGLYSVATLPEWRGKGFAEAVMRHAIADARAGGAAGPLVLQSSPAGLGLYKLLGFKRSTRFLVFATPQARR